MDLMFLNMHIFRMFDRLVTVLDEHVKVQELLILDLAQPSLHFTEALLEDFSGQIRYSILLNTKVRGEFQFCHLVDFQTTYHTNDLVNSLLVLFYGFLYRQLACAYTLLDVLFDLLQELRKEVGIFC